MFVFSCVHNKVDCLGICLYFTCVVCIRNWSVQESVSSSQNTTSRNLSKCLGMHPPFMQTLLFPRKTLACITAVE